MPDFEYDGSIYVRPVSRGVSLVDLGWQPLDEAIEQAVQARYGTVSDWHGHATITVEIGDELTDAPKRSSAGD